MRKDDLEVPARYYLRLIEQLQSLGVDTRTLFSRARIKPHHLLHPDAALRLSQVERVVDLAYEMSGRTDLGMDLGRTLTMSTHSIVGFGMLSSPNAERALQFCARYFRLVMPAFSLRYLHQPGQAELEFSPLVGMSHQCLAFHIETIAVAAYREVQELLSDKVPEYRIHLTIPSPPHARRYREFNRARWTFGVERTPGIRCLFDYDLHRFPLSMADSNALKMAEARCRELVTRVAADEGFASWVEMMLREASGPAPSLAELAAILNLSTRTLDRHLKREGTGFRDLFARVQHEQACERLLGSTLSVTEVAYSLGYSDPANFTRAFRSREGCGPREFRIAGTTPRRA